MTTKLPEFEDPQVQIAYGILAEMPEGKPEDHHWEGWCARHIVAALADFQAEIYSRNNEIRSAALRKLSDLGYSYNSDEESFCPAGIEQENFRRYSWLRHGDNDERVLVKAGWGTFLPRLEKLDAAIDEAMSIDTTTEPPKEQL